MWSIGRFSSINAAFSGRDAQQVIFFDFYLLDASVFFRTNAADGIYKDIEMSPQRCDPSASA